MGEWLFWVSAIGAGIFLGLAVDRLCFRIQAGQWVFTFPWAR